MLSLNLHYIVAIIIPAKRIRNDILPPNRQLLIKKICTYAEENYKAMEPYKIYRSVKGG